ncbi:hypothetical protein [Rhizobium leucaenae]|uniref:DUF4174 domain-containing protein n=1 Tax=Rhizobium leucaenae TaxID=29450 RepID=A0A7W6ZYI0_9HYPH|nr:hypothetical protein [Rhizobium leucaenae]MBB4571117.1 hypothetical protein [Rhizobium leucaenae]MBB6304211.1 hypothetical protein [Rhizobium leucaenae]
MTIIDQCRELERQPRKTAEGLEIFRDRKAVAVIFSDLAREAGPEQERLILKDCQRLQDADLAVVRVYDGQVTPLYGAANGLRPKVVRAQLDANSVVDFCVILVSKEGEVLFRSTEPTEGDVLLALL